MTQKNKNAAAVLTSVALEIHLKKLCGKNNIGTINDNGNSKKASKLNIELYEKMYIRLRICKHNGLAQYPK